MLRVAYAIYRSDIGKFWFAWRGGHEWGNHPALYETREEAERVIPRLKGMQPKFDYSERRFVPFMEYEQYVSVVKVSYGFR